MQRIKGKFNFFFFFFFGSGRKYSLTSQKAIGGPDKAKGKAKEQSSQTQKFMEECLFDIHGFFPHVIF